MITPESEPKGIRSGGQMSTGSSLAAIFLADVLQITIARPGGKGLVVMAVISRKKVLAVILFLSFFSRNSQRFLMISF